MCDSRHGFDYVMNTVLTRRNITLRQHHSPQKLPLCIRQVITSQTLTEGCRLLPHFVVRLCGIIIFLDQADDQVRFTGFLRSSFSARLRIIATIWNFRADGCQPHYSWAGKNGAWTRPVKIAVLAALEPDQW